MTVLVIDIGSSSSRALLFDDHAQPIPGARASRSYEFVTSPPGASIIDADELRHQVEACIDDILSHPAARLITLVAMDTFVGNVVGLGADGRPITPLYTYADTRSTQDVAALVNEVDPVLAHQRTGCRVHTAYLPGRLRWLRRTQPHDYAHVRRWVDFGTYLYSHWFNRIIPATFSVSAWTGLFNREQAAWDAAWLSHLELEPVCLPQLSDYDAPAVGLFADYAKRWPLLADLPFFLALGDGASANVGSGCIDKTRIALTLGTTGAVRLVTDDALPPVPDGLWSYRVNRRLHLIGGATSEGGSVFGWARDVLRLPDNDTLESLLSSLGPAQHGLTVLPLLAGERSPGWLANAAGTISGIRLSTTALDIMQAILESIALRLAIITSQVTQVAAPDAQIIAGGGAITASHVWAQMIANAINKPLNITHETETTARGTAILALVATGRGTLFDYPVRISNVITPQPAAAATLQQALHEQTALYQTLYHREI